jgi:hypothetical protein
MARTVIVPLLSLAQNQPEPLEIGELFDMPAATQPPPRTCWKDRDTHDLFGGKDRDTHDLFNPSGRWLIQNCQSTTTSWQRAKIGLQLLQQTGVRKAESKNLKVGSFW